MTLLNAVLNALSDSYPNEAEIVEMESPEFASLSAASSTRQCVKYSIGDAPTSRSARWFGAGNVVSMLSGDPRVPELPVVASTPRLPRSVAKEFLGSIR
jgi:hypothetical protein